VNKHWNVINNVANVSTETSHVLLSTSQALCPPVSHGFHDAVFSCLWVVWFFRIQAEENLVTLFLILAALWGECTNEIRVETLTVADLPNKFTASYERVKSLNRRKIVRVHVSRATCWNWLQQSRA
jgi:hypothetical protein